MKPFRDLCVLAGIALSFVFCIVGCGPVAVQHEGKQEYHVYHHYEPQKVDVDIHKGWRRRHQQP